MDLPFESLKQDVDEVAIKPEKYTEDKHSLEGKFSEVSDEGTSSHLTDLKEEGGAGLHDIHLRIFSALSASKNTLQALVENIGKEITGKSNGSDALVHLLKNWSVKELRKKIRALYYNKNIDKWLDVNKQNVKNSIDISTFDITLLTQILEKLSVLLKQKLNNHCTTCTVQILKSGGSSCIECGKVADFVRFVRVLRNECCHQMENSFYTDFAAGNKTFCGFSNQVDLFKRLHQLNGDCVSFLRDANLLTNTITKDQGDKLIKSVYSTLYDPIEHVKHHQQATALNTVKDLMVFANEQKLRSVEFELSLAIEDNSTRSPDDYVYVNPFSLEDTRWTSTLSRNIKATAINKLQETFGKFTFEKSCVLLQKSARVEPHNNCIGYTFRLEGKDSTFPVELNDLNSTASNTFCIDIIKKLKKSLTSYYQTPINVTLRIQEI